jgi:hypothetical protein
MTGRVQSLRSSTAGNRPTGRQPGELYANFADAQLGVVNAANTAQDLIGVRFFSSAGSYAVGDHVIQGGRIQRAIAAISPGAFNVNQWSPVATMADLNSTVAGFLPLSGGTMTGAIILPAAAPTVAAQAANKSYVDTGDAASMAAANAATALANTMLPLTGGTLTGGLIGVNAAFSSSFSIGGGLSVNGAISYPDFYGHAIKFGWDGANLRAAVDNTDVGIVNGCLPLAGGTMSGSITLPFNGSNIAMYGTCNVYSDTGTWGFGESADIRTGTSWRYVFDKASGTRIWYDSNGRAIMVCDPAGNLSIAGVLGQGSDVDLKRDIVDAPDGIEQVRLMRPRRYHRRIHDNPPADVEWTVPDREELGFVAQEMQEALPHAVRDHDENTLAIDLMPLIATLTNAIKNLDARLEAIENSSPTSVTITKGR